MLYTKKGDRGKSGLFGTSKRLHKDSPIYDALGTLDELNSFLGLCRAHIGTVKVNNDIDMSKLIFEAQEAVFVIQAELAGSDKRIKQSQVEALEKTVDNIESIVGNPHAFVVAGATPLSAWFDVVRTVVRRTERAVINARSIREVSLETKAYLNRLSSLLYALARYAAYLDNVSEAQPSYT